jgi:tight adherence protein C
MSVALLLAAGAGIAAAAGVGELAALPRTAASRSAGPRGLAALAGLAARAGRDMGARAPRDLAARAAAAGVEAPVGDLMALKAGLALLVAAVVLPLAPAAPGRLGVAALLAGPAAGFLLPDLALRRRARTRRGILERELADVLDLLRVAVAAGLPPRRALLEVGRRHPGLLAAELRRAAGRATLGERGEAAWTGLAARCPADGVAALVVALRRAERHGAPLAGTLEALAVEARTRRAQRTLEVAARAAPKIQLLVALLLVPAVLLLVAAALLPALAPG